MLCDAIFSVGTGNILENVVRLKSALTNITEPDFGLLDELLRLEVLTRPELADVRSERTVYRRNAALLDLLNTEDQCGKFLNALQRTGQQHIVNFVTQNGGQKNSDITVGKLLYTLDNLKHSNEHGSRVRAGLSVTKCVMQWLPQWFT